MTESLNVPSLENFLHMCGLTHWSEILSREFIDDVDTLALMETMHYQELGITAAEQTVAEEGLRRVGAKD